MRDFDEYLMESYELREKLVADKFRPRYHFVPPEGRWNDINGSIFWNGRYHIGYLQKIPNGPDERDFSSWQHISSRDLLHWRYHKASLREPLEGSRGDYFNSGDVMAGTDPPAIIVNMPMRGICIYQSQDDNLDEWVALPENPVIPLDPAPEMGWRSMASSKLPECVIFDPSGWKEGDVYYALIGNKNHRPGYEGDSTSLFKSKDLREWEYVGPFYKSDRKWTEEIEDCACSNFFPFGEKHMLVMHTHQPFAKAQYYIGRYEDEQFYPEINGQLSREGSLLAGPETLVDDRGRRIFWGWLRDARADWAKHGWYSMMTLPWHFSPADDNSLLIDPVEELRSLRYDEKRHGDVTLSEGDEQTLEGFESDCMEIKLTIEAKDAARFGMKLLCSPGGEEETVVTYDAEEQQFVVDFERASEDGDQLTYGRSRREDVRGGRQQVVPFPLNGEGRLDIDLFVDRSVIEIFVNSRICIAQRVYPTRDDSMGFKLFAKDRPASFRDIVKWEMDATNPW